MRKEGGEGERREEGREGMSECACAVDDCITSKPIFKGDVVR